MDARIGQLNSGKFYAFIGAAREYVEGTLEQVEVALGLRTAAAVQCLQLAPQQKTFNVRLTFQFPAWDEKDGILYTNIVATSKAKANAAARQQAYNDGHLNGGQGRATFTATEV